MQCLILALLLAAAAAKDDRIVGGYQCPTHSQPWQVSLNSGGHYCGGSLINEQWVLSAGHCYTLPDKFEIHLGADNLCNEGNTVQHIGVAKAIKHQHFNPYTLDNDIMLIKLAQPARLNSYVQPVPLASSCLSAGTICKISGWGYTLSGGFPCDLQCLNLPVMPDSVCKSSYPGMITQSMICMGYEEGGKDACECDSGGPVVCNGELKGIVSWGEGCAEQGHPGVYTNLCKFTDWIQEIINNN
uniref:trypsin-2-like n=1 Tax=Myxine glutinosa TaxID=7769 RepID=UPI0035900DB7